MLTRWYTSRTSSLISRGTFYTSTNIDERIKSKSRHTYMKSCLEIHHHWHPVFPCTAHELVSTVVFDNTDYRKSDNAKIISNYQLTYYYCMCWNLIKCYSGNKARFTTLGLIKIPLFQISTSSRLKSSNDNKQKHIFARFDICGIWSIC